MKRRVLGSVVVILLLVAGLLFWRGRPAPAPEATETPVVVVRVKVAVARRRQLASQSVAQGSVFPLRQAMVSAVQGGVISEMQLWKNRRVNQGEVVAVLNMRDLQAQRNEAVALVREMEVNLHNLQNSSTRLADANAAKDLALTASTLRNAEGLYRRRQQLFAQGGIAYKDLQDAQTAASIARANFQLSQRSAGLLRTATNPGSIELARVKLEQARLRVATLSSPLTFAHIRAPISGTVIDQFQYVGEYVTPGTKLLALADLSEVIVKGQFADTILAQLQVGERAEVRPLDRPGVKLEGRVSALSAVTDAQSRSGEVWVQLHNADGKLRSGGFCEITVAARAVPAIVIPAAAVTRESPESRQGTVAVVDSQNVAHLRAVVCGPAQAGWVQVESGVKPDERVVVDGNYRLEDGVHVQVQGTLP